MDLSKLNKILSYTILILFIVLAILSITYKYSHCQTCQFKIENKTLKADKFMKIYIDECSEKQINQLSLLNFSLSQG